MPRLRSLILEPVPFRHPLLSVLQPYLLLAVVEPRIACTSPQRTGSRLLLLDLCHQSSSSLCASTSPRCGDCGKPGGGNRCACQCDVYNDNAGHAEAIQGTRRVYRLLFFKRGFSFSLSLCIRCECFGLSTIPLARLAEELNAHSNVSLRPREPNYPYAHDQL